MEVVLVRQRICCHVDAGFLAFQTRVAVVADRLNLFIHATQHNTQLSAQTQQMINSGYTLHYFFVHSMSPMCQRCADNYWPQCLLSKLTKVVDFDICIHIISILLKTKTGVITY